MRSLYLISASLAGYPADAVRAGLEAFLPREIARDLVSSIVLYPQGIDPPASSADRRCYGTTLSLAGGAEIWRPLASIPFDRLFVLGSEPPRDVEEIAIACFLDATKKSYLDMQGGARDLASWQKDLRPGFRPEPVTVKPLSETERTDYVARVHQWLAAEMMARDFDEPEAQRQPSPDDSLYTRPRLALDLAQLTGGLQIEAHGEAYSTLAMPDGTIVRSPDSHRAVANFVMAVDGVHDVLDVGCGSGLLDCYLAASGKYERVTGVDSAPSRIADARFHAELVGSEAQFVESSMAKLDFPDKSFDLCVTFYALEQSGNHLNAAVQELCRVARKYLILVEPTTQFFPTLPGIWHVRQHGWADGYFAALQGLNYAVRPNLLGQYYNPSSVFVVDLTGRDNPVVALPHLFRPNVADWPGEVIVDPPG